MLYAQHQQQTDIVSCQLVNTVQHVAAEKSQIVPSKASGDQNQSDLQWISK